METPSSTRRITRSQVFAAANNSNMSKKFEETEYAMSKSRQRSGKQQDRSALIDITNDSPIVGLAMGNLDTPSSKKRFNISSKHTTTPGSDSGEALLRGQVKTLLQKVEEEAVLSKIPIEYRQFHGIVTSPMALLAPTPANTPQLSDVSGNGNSVDHVLASLTASPIQEQFKFFQMINDMIEGRRQDSAESEKNPITRSLLLDFSEKTEDSFSTDSTSALTYQGGECGSEISDDNASLWSIQVNASVGDEEEEDGGLLVDELCEGINNIDVNDEGIMGKGWIAQVAGAKFVGKHSRFVYNSDDEFEGEAVEVAVEISTPKGNHIRFPDEEDNSDDEFEEKEEAIEVADETSASGALPLKKGLPTPKGKHLRFPEED